MIASESRGTTGKGKVEGQVSWGKYPPTPSFCYGRIVVWVRKILSLHNVEDILDERGICISHETIRFWLK